MTTKHRAPAFAAERPAAAAFRLRPGQRQEGGRCLAL